MSHLSIFRNFWEPFLKHKMEYLMMCKKRILYLCEDRIEKPVPPDQCLSSPGKPHDANGDPRDRFFYPTLTLMMGP